MSLIEICTAAVMALIIRDSILPLIYAALDRWSARKGASPVAQAQPDKHDKAEGLGCLWHAMPGGRLELGDTGYFIELCRDPDSPPYRGYSPEGHDFGSAHSLALVKSFIEIKAKERAEFTTQAERWKPSCLKRAE